ncbi:MAG: branched-chain amino acid transaminase [Bacteroidota bacterium]
MSKPRIWFNGELVAHEDATIHVLSHVVHYGSSVFEGIRAYATDRGPAVFRLEEHMARLIDSAKIHRMDLGYSVDELCDAVVETVGASGLDACYIRPVSFRGHGPMGVNPLNNPVHTVIAVWEWGAYLGAEAMEQGVDVQVSSWNRPAPNTLPAMAKAGGNYLGGSLIKMEAIKNGFSEGIALSVDGLLSEGSGENLFIVRDGEIATPPQTLSILPGITRDSVIQIARQRGYTVTERSLPREALYLADELFFTGTAAEVTPIRTVDHYTIGTGSRGPITEELQSAYFEALHDVTDARGWLTFVSDSASTTSGGDGVATQDSPVVGS